MKNGIKLLNGLELNKENAQYFQHEEVIEITFSPEHTYEEIYSIFSPVGSKYNKNNLKEISMTEGGENVGHWFGYTDTVGIKKDIKYLYSPCETQPEESVNVIVSLKKEAEKKTFMEESVIMLGALMDKVDMEVKSSKQATERLSKGITFNDEMSLLSLEVLTLLAETAAPQTSTLLKTTNTKLDEKMISIWARAIKEGKKELNECPKKYSERVLSRVNKQ